MGPEETPEQALTRLQDTCRGFFADNTEGALLAHVAYAYLHALGYRISGFRSGNGTTDGFRGAIG